MQPLNVNRGLCVSYNNKKKTFHLFDRSFPQLREEEGFSDFGLYCGVDKKSNGRFLRSIRLAHFRST